VFERFVGVDARNRLMTQRLKRNGLTETQNANAAVADGKGEAIKTPHFNYHGAEELVLSPSRLQWLQAAIMQAHFGDVSVLCDDDSSSGDGTDNIGRGGFEWLAARASSREIAGENICSGPATIDINVTTALEVLASRRRRMGVIQSDRDFEQLQMYVGAGRPLQTPQTDSVRGHEQTRKRQEVWFERLVADGVPMLQTGQKHCTWHWPFEPVDAAYLSQEQQAERDMQQQLQQNLADNSGTKKDKSASGLSTPEGKKHQPAVQRHQYWAATAAATTLVTKALALAARNEVGGGNGDIGTGMLSAAAFCELIVPNCLPVSERKYAVLASRTRISEDEEIAQSSAVKIDRTSSGIAYKLGSIGRKFGKFKEAGVDGDDGGGVGSDDGIGLASFLAQMESQLLLASLYRTAKLVADQEEGASGRTARRTTGGTAGVVPFESDGENEEDDFDTAFSTSSGFNASAPSTSSSSSASLHSSWNGRLLAVDRPLWIVLRAFNYNHMLQLSCLVKCGPSGTGSAAFCTLSPEGICCYCARLSL
jgi:hypothetical protein